MTIVFAVTGLDNQIWTWCAAGLDTTPVFAPAHEIQVEGPVTIAARDDRHYLCLARTDDGGLHLADVDDSHELSFSPLAEGSLASSAPALLVVASTLRAVFVTI